MRDDDRDIDDLIAERQAANPRSSPGREPAGAGQARRLIGATLAILAAATLVLAAVLLLGS